MKGRSLRRPNPTEWASIHALFDRIVDQPPQQQERALTGADADPYVTQRVRAMLAAHSTQGVLDTLNDQPFDGGDLGYSSLAEGAIVGAFRIIRLIGRGGMGEVYLAERSGDSFVQRVALKLLRPEAASRMALFDAERRTLAGLEHPGIARLIDGGLAPDGRPFMAIEYVEGQPITTWCTGHGASLDDRLRLVLELCDALTYAHGQLVIHRDLKPANILVDKDGRARLLDFGVAKLIDDALGDTPADARTTQALLTPDYAAPEQFRHGRISVATDIYALGAVLFELLAGTGAWAGDGGRLPTALKRVVDHEPEPASRVAARNPHPPVPPARLAGDLDAIIAKAMRTAPQDRYASVASMADDIRRHLRFEPVQARKGSFGYQLRRFARRHRGAAIASVATVLALVAGASGIAWQAHKAAVERDIAKAAARRAEAVNNAVSLMFRNAQEFGRGRDASAHDLLDDSAARLIQSFGEDSRDTASIVAALGQLYIQIDDATGAESLLSTALAKGVGRTDPAGRARLQMDLGTVEGATGKLDEAGGYLDAADKVWARDPERYAKERMEAIAARAQIMRQKGDRDAAIKLLTDSLPDAEKAYADDPRALLIRYNNLAVHLVEANKLDALDAVLKRAEAVSRRFHQEQTPIAIALMQLRGGWYSRSDRQAEALATFERGAALRRKLYGPSRMLSTDLLQVGRSMAALGQPAKALPILQEADAMAREYTGPTAPVTIMTGITLGETYGRLGKVAEGRAALAAVEPALQPLGQTGILYGAWLRARVQVDEAAGDYAKAAADLDAAEKIFAALGDSATPYSKSIAGLRTDLAKKVAKAKSSPP